jgi:serine/threonine-protein kinase
MLSHYRLVEKIGEGGMGVVYKAFDTHLKRQVAIKILKPELTSDPTLRQRFLREARAAAAFHHPNIATVHDIGESDGVAFIVMEFVEGETLRARMAGRAMLVDGALRIAVDIASGLGRAHRESIVHRDLKPENICIDRDGYAKILDFGLARLIEQRDREQSEALSRASTQSQEATSEGQLLGTASYMSPEQARGEPVDQRSDLFSFGIILYEMLTGRRPFDRKSRLETFAAILREEPEAPSRVNHRIPHKLDRIILRCLAKALDDRYSRTDELLGDLRKALHLPARVLPPHTGTEPLPARRLSPTAAAVATALVAIMAIGYWLWHDVLTPSPATDGRPEEVAFMPLVFDGQEEMEHLKNTIPMIMAGGLIGEERFRVIPFDIARSFPPDERPRVIGRMLSVSWIVQGRLFIEGEYFELSSAIYGGAQRQGERPVSDGADPLDSPVWSTTVKGEMARLIPLVSELGNTIASVLGAPRPREEQTVRAKPNLIALILEGRSYLRGWDVEASYQRAQERARDALAIDEQSAEAHALLALALVARYTDMKEPSAILEAEEVAARAVQLAPSLPEAYEALGTVHLWRGHSVAAEQAFAKGLRMAPGDDALCRRVADAYAQLGRDEEAETMYRRAINLRPSLWVNHNAMGVFYLERGRFEEAESPLRRVVELNPGSNWGYTNLAALHILRGDHEEAEPLLQAALRLNPTHETHNNLGFVYYALGRFEDAAEQWSLAIEGGSHSTMYYANLGDAYRQLGRTDDARSVYERAVELGRDQLTVQPADWESRAMISTALAGLGRCDDALDETERAVSDAGNNPTVYYYAAIAYALCADRAAATRYTGLAIQGGIKADVRTNPDLLPLLADPSLQSLLE